MPTHFVVNVAANLKPNYQRPPDGGLCFAVCFNPQHLSEAAAPTPVERSPAEAGATALRFEALVIPTR
jgi:hypothetical protein